jgi:hypothetical protein
MRKILHAAFAAAVGAIGLAACGATPPPEAAVSRPAESAAIAVSPSVEPEAMATRESIADVLRDEDAYSRARRLGTLLPTLGPEAVPAVKGTLGEKTRDFGAIEIELLVRFWATHQPADASRWAFYESSPAFRIPAILCSFTLWAEADPQAALKAAKEWLVYSDEVDAVLQVALVRGWFANNPPELEQYIYDLGRSFQRQRALIAFIRLVIQKRGADAVMRWAEAIPDDDALSSYKKVAYMKTTAALALFDREAAMRWCEAHCDARYGWGMRAIIAGHWAKSDGPAALAWLFTAPEGYERDLAVRGTFADWGRRDHQAAMAWMAARTTGQPDPRLRPLFPVYALLLLRDSRPLEAIEWAQRIEDEKDREDFLIRLLREWRGADAAAAEAWLRESSLSEEKREKARIPMGRPRRPSG